MSLLFMCGAINKLIFPSCLRWFQSAGGQFEKSKWLVENSPDEDANEFELPIFFADSDQMILSVDKKNRFIAIEINHCGARIS